MKVLPDEKRAPPPYTMPKYPHFLAVRTKFDTFYFQITCWKKRKSVNERNILISEIVNRIPKNTWCLLNLGIYLFIYNATLSLQATPLVRLLVHCREVELIRGGLLYMNNYSQINAIIENKFNTIVDTCRIQDFLYFSLWTMKLTWYLDVITTHWVRYLLNIRSKNYEFTPGL